MVYPTTWCESQDVVWLKLCAGVMEWTGMRWRVWILHFIEHSCTTVMKHIFDSDDQTNCKTINDYLVHWNEKYSTQRKFHGLRLTDSLCILLSTYLSIVSPFSFSLCLPPYVFLPMRLPCLIFVLFGYAGNQVWQMGVNLSGVSNVWTLLVECTYVYSRYVWLYYWG